MTGPWYKNPLLWASCGVGGFLLYYYDVGHVASSVASGVTDMMNRGNKVSTGVLNSTSGIVSPTPDALLAQARLILGDPSLDMDTYALARMIRSEGAAEGNLRAHVALNDLESLGWSSLFQLFTFSTDSSRKGFFGSQYTAPNATYPKQSVRRYATPKDPFAADIQVAKDAIAEHAQGIDPSQGAVKFVDKSSMGGVQSGTGSYAALEAKWAKDGLKPYNLPEFGDDLVLFRKTG